MLIFEVRELYSGCGETIYVFLRDLYDIVLKKIFIVLDLDILSSVNDNWH